MQLGGSWIDAGLKLLGLAGFVLGLMNYLRDRARLRVVLEWHLPTELVPEVRGYVRVLNEGRRNVELRRVGLIIPREPASLYLNLEMKPLEKSIEGGRSENFYFEEHSLYGADWRLVRAFAEDFRGRRYESRKVRRKLLRAIERETCCIHS